MALAIPKLPKELTEAHWKKNALPKIKNKWKQECGKTNISFCLRSLDSHMMGVLKHGTPADAKRFDTAFKTLKANLAILEKTLQKQQKDPDAKEVLAITEKMRKAIPVFCQRTWPTEFLRQLDLSNINGLPMKKGFFEFAKTDYVTENVEFAKEATIVKKDPKALLELYEKFVHKYAPSKTKINISGTLRAKWVKPMELIEAHVRPKDIRVDKLQLKQLKVVEEVMKLKAETIKEVIRLTGEAFTRYRRQLFLNA